MNASDRRMRLYERIREVAASERNLKNQAAWERPDGAFRMFLGASYFSRALGIDMREYYHNPEVYLETNLRLGLLAFEEFQDDVPVSTHIAWHPGVVMEPSLFGVAALYPADKEPWEPHTYILEDKEDLAKLSMPDFYENDAMRYIHSMYNQLGELLAREAPDFDISFPLWRRAPFGVACCLRGMERLCFDFYDEPEFVRKLLGFITESQISWTRAYEKFTGRSDMLTLGNDEVNTPTLSPGLYEEFILPSERRLTKELGPLQYFHSCGCLTPLIPQIKTLKPKLFHVSPWTDLEEVCREFAGTDTVLDVWAHVTDDVMCATYAQAETAMKRRVDICRKADIGGFQFNSGNMQAVGASAEEDNRKMKQWVSACRSAVSKEKW